MKAIELLRRRIPYTETSFVRGECVLRYDNEAGKGDHRHYRGKESAFTFESPEQLIAAFQRDIARYQREDRDA